MKKYSVLATSLLLLIPVDSFAAGKLSTTEKIVLFESAIAANSLLAAADPHLYGAIGSLALPASFISDRYSTTTNVVTLVGTESIAFYNLNIDEKSRTKSEVFRKNMIGWHMFAAIAGLTGYLMGDITSIDSIVMSPTPGNGIKIAYNLKF